VGKQVWFDGTDVSELCAHMTYIQMSAAGIAGVVRHGNTLTLEQWGAWMTEAALVRRFLSHQSEPAETEEFTLTG
jgi:hypothetical protein